MKKMIMYFADYFHGHERSMKVKKNVVYLILLKGLSIAVGLAFVPLILGYIDAERYGIWLSISSIISWFYFFDIGLGNGLRNKFAEAIAQGDHVRAKTYVSTTYFILGGIFLLVLLLFFFVNPFLNWQRILNTAAVGNQELSLLISYTFTVLIVQFVLKLISTVLMADQKSALSSSLNTFGNLLALVVIIVLIKTTSGSLTNLALVLTLAPASIYLAATIYLFYGKYRLYYPSYKYVSIGESKALIGLGLKFFIIQMAGIVFFSVTNIFIAQFANQEAVAEYNIVNKYFGVGYLVYGILLTPIWSAVTDAYSKGDHAWLVATLKRLNLLSVVIVCLIVVLLFSSPAVFQLWIGDTMGITFSLSLMVALYMITKTILAPFSTYLNGFGKLKLSLIVLSIQVVFYIPLALFLGGKYGAIGIILAMTLVNITSMFQEPVQVYKIISKKAKGIWNK